MAKNFIENKICTYICMGICIYASKCTYVHRCVYVHVFVYMFFPYMQKKSKITLNPTIWR